MKEGKTEQIRRIEKNEKILDRAQKTLRKLEEAISSWKAMQPDIQELDLYYQSDLWKQDLQDDEEGRLPKDLKRGVLSQDGIYDVLETNAEMADRIRFDEEE